LVFLNQGQALAEAIMLGMAHGVCNGLYMSEASPEYATATWLLEDSRFPHQTSATALSMSLVSLLMSMHIELNFKAFMPFSLLSNQSTPTTPLPQAQS